MPGILISFTLLFVAVLTAWFNRCWGIITFSIFLVVAGLVFFHHATNHLSIYL
ncbi:MULTISPECIES: DUF5993 family protein [Francisella]|uniref:DUF5993 family protein n=1 Tax=Francisella TaxID=262 RepID=UPI000A5A1EA8|nr:MULTISPECIES: DUF5993 family protein [Francisella]